MKKMSLFWAGHTLPIQKVTSSKSDWSCAKSASETSQGFLTIILFFRPKQIKYWKIYMYIYFFLLRCTDHITQILDVLHDKILLVTLSITFWPFSFVLLCTRQASKSSLKNRSTCYSATARGWCQTCCVTQQKPMWFDVLPQCEGHAGIWCSMAETGIQNFLPNLISAKI